MTTPEPDAPMSLPAAVLEALAAGANILDTRPYTLSEHGDWSQRISGEALRVLRTADPETLSQALAMAADWVQYMAHYRRALEAGDQQNMAWWRQRLLEDYGYTGPFPGDPPEAT
jgi:hypothetical protein